MPSFLAQNFDSLKKLVLTVSELGNISPGDCKTLSLKIFKKTNQQVSETTLKRIYGFAYSKFKPSLFTLDAMAKFTGFSSWADFCENNADKPLTKHSQDVSWDKIKQNADKITGFTLQVLKNKSGVPYNLTVQRQFINDHFAAFTKGNYEATVLTAPAGYGKTVALCHWIEERMLISNDIILFFSSNALINVFLSGKDINEWLLSLLGFGSEDDFSTLLDIKQKHEGNFYLIIDGLDEHIFKKEQFQALLNQILDVFSFHQDHDIFKLILTMRSSTWINNKHEFDNLNQEWFHGFSFTDDPFINVPLFSVQEIKELCLKINPADKCEVSAEVAESFSHPLYFQFYYKQHRDHFSFENVDHLSIYELVTNFILNKIYLGSLSAEKAILNQAIVENMDFAHEKYEVDKLAINELIVKYNAAYNELLGVGFLREINKSGDLQFKTVIQLGNNNFLNYAMARLLLIRNKNIFDQHVVNSLNELFPNGRKLQVLKWCIIYAIKNGQQESFQYLAETRLNVKEKSELIIFLGDMFKKESSSLKNSEAMIHYFQQDYTDGLFNYFFGVEYINTDYKKTLQTLLLFELSPEKKILAYTSLAVIAVIQLDMSKLEEYLGDLKSFSPADLQGLSINPVSCVETIYYYLKYGIVKKEAFIELTKFYFNPPQTEAASTKNSTNDILYLLGTYTLSICKNPNKVLRFTNAVKKIYKKEHHNSSGFCFLLKIMRAEAYLLLNRPEEGLTIYNELLSLYNSEKKSYTPFMIASFHLLKAKVFLYDNKKANLQESLNLIFYLADQSDFKLIKIQALAFILKNKEVLKDEVYYKDAQHNFMEIIHESGFKKDGFIDGPALLDM
jgi:hypothetical protein